MKTLLIMLTLIPAVASAKPIRPGGPALFEIQHRADTQLATDTIKIFPSGKWSYQPVSADGKLGALTVGWLDQDAMDDVRDAVKAAPWQITFNRIVCFAYSPKFTNYLVHGKLVYTARMCGNQSVDATSRKSIQTIEATMAHVVPHPEADRFIYKPRAFASLF